MKFVLSALSLLSLPAILFAQNYTIVVQPNGGNGTCSNGNVTALSYNVTAPLPGLSAVLAGNQASYQALINANLSAPSTANLPPPLLSLSCLTPNITNCTQVFPANMQLNPQVMCVLLKNSGTSNITAQLNVVFTYANSSSSNNTSPPPPPSTQGNTGSLLTYGGWMALVTVVAVLVV